MSEKLPAPGHSRKSNCGFATTNTATTYNLKRCCGTPYAEASPVTCWQSYPIDANSNNTASNFETSVAASESLIASTFSKRTVAGHAHVMYDSIPWKV